jgi:two-component system response regulator FixJ
MSVAAPIICLVDDDPSVLKSLHRLLASEGYAVLAFNNPAEFIRHATGHPVPLAVVDYAMPGLTGLQVQSCLHSLSPETPVIMITANTDPAVTARIRAGGARALLHKPFTNDAFLAAVRDVLGHPDPSSPAISPPHSTLLSTLP